MSLITRLLNQKRKKRIKIDGNNDDENNDDLSKNNKENVLPSASQLNIRNNNNLSSIRKFFCGCTRANSIKSRNSNIIPTTSAKQQQSQAPEVTKTKTITTTTTCTTQSNNQVNIKIIEIKEENEILSINDYNQKIVTEQVIQTVPECKILINEIDDTEQPQPQQQQQTMGFRIMQSPEVVINEIRKISIKSTNSSTKRRKSTTKKKKNSITASIRNNHNNNDDDDDDDDEEDDDDDDDDYDDEENTSENDKFFDLKPPAGMKLNQHRGSHQPTTGNTYSVCDGYPKFLTANNILTDRGCIVNIRTGSFNLGCTPNSNMNSNDRTSISMNSNDSNNNQNLNENNNGDKSSNGNNNNSNNNGQVDNSNSGNNSKTLIVPSLNVSDMNYSDDPDYDDENNDNFDENLSDCNYNATHLLAASPNFNLLTANTEQLDPFRRCSHDPNIEKLHKTYINNVKLLDVPTPTTSIATLTAVTSSLSICKKSSSDSSFYNENPTNKRLRVNNANSKFKSTTNTGSGGGAGDGGNTDDGDSNLLSANSQKRDSIKSKSAELLNEGFNEMSKVNEWLIDNHNHHNRRHSGNKAISATNITTTETTRKNSKDNNPSSSAEVKCDHQQQQQQLEQQQSSKGQKKLKQKRKVTYIDEKTGQTLGTKIINNNDILDIDADYDDDDDDDDYDGNNTGDNYVDDNNDEDDDDHECCCSNKDKNGVNQSANEKALSKTDATAAKNWKTYKSDTNSSNPTDQTHDFETNDSAVDIESYDTMSSVSKASSKSRTHWQSFSKNYHLHFFHSTTWSKYQISAMSLDQIMALRKLALIQFSKLVERQHSSVIRTFRLFSKKRDVEEFKRVYDIDATTNSKQIDKSSSINDVNLTNVHNSNINTNNKNSTNSALNYSKSKKQAKNPSNNNSLEESSFIDTSTNAINSNNLNTSCSINTTTSIGGTSCSSNNASNIATSAINSVSTAFNVITSSVTTSIRPCDLRASTVVFGLPLHIIMQRTGQPLPQKIIEAMKILRKLAPRAIGIFRKNGVKTRINKLKDAIDNNEEFNFHLFYTLYDIADMIKLYFRLLPECLITNKLSDILLANYSKVSPEERKLILQQVMLLIPDESRLALQTLLLFLNDIAKHAKTNQMTRNNLAVCFSPVLFHLNVETKKKKLYNRHRKQQQQQQLLKTEDKSRTSTINESLSNIATNENSSVILNIEPQTSASSTLNIIQPQTSSLSREQSPLHVPQQQQPKRSLIPQQTLENYKRKCSQTLNKAASSIANFSAGIVDINSSTYSANNHSVVENIENLSRVGQLCVSDMIKYSMDLFTVPIENFEKLKLSLFYGSEPYDFEYYYDRKENKLKKEDFFKSNLNMQKLYWSYYDKYEDISIYYYKNEQLQQQSNQHHHHQHQQEQNFNEKLKLWKCCTLIKQQNINLEKILQRIANERLLWDDDFKEGKLIEKLDENTDTYKYVISLMPPHPSRDFTEIRHWSKQNDSTLIYTTTSIKSNDRLIGDIRANMIMSKYIIEKLIDNESVNTFKITHLMKLDYKGFTIEFYNKSLGYLMARLLHRLKLSLTT